MKKNKTKKIFGILIAMGGTALVIQGIPLYIWYFVLLGLIVILAIVVFMNQ